VPYIDPVYVAELYGHLAVLRRADTEPVWRRELRPAAKDPHAYLHDLILFMSLDMLERVFGTVGPLLSSTSAFREPDLFFTVGNHPVRLEVKVPERLILFDVPIEERASSMGDSDAERIIHGAINASVGTHGQIRPDRPGIVVVGGFNLIPDETKAMETAARAKRSYLLGAGVHFMNFGRGLNLYGAGRVMPGFHVLPNEHATGPVRLTSMSRIEAEPPGQPSRTSSPRLRASFRLLDRFVINER
jgi:hypothetical protein